MKKPIVSVVGLAALLLASCGAPEGETQAKDAYAPLNEMLKAEYSQIALTVTDTFDEETSLTSEYIFVRSEGSVTVQYTVERFEALGLPGTDGADGGKTVLSGKAVLQEGSFLCTEGDPVEFPAQIAAGGLSFKAEYFEDAELAGVYFKATVKDAGGFFGVPLSCTEMKVSATFLDFFYEIEIVYTSSGGGRTEYRYEFSV